jgi:Ca-activated chloride channel family protein
LTDGANNSGQIDPITAAQIAKALDIRVYTIGAARPGPAALPFPDGRVEYRDSEIDEETLQQIADITGGLYFRAEDAEGLREIYDTINHLERSQIEVRTFYSLPRAAVWLIVPAVYF